MLTGRQPWAELASPLQVLFVVGVERRRLPIPPGTPPPLARLLREAWRHSAALRPTSASLLRRVRQLRSAEQLALQKPSRQGGSLGASSSRSIGGSPRAARQQGKAASPKAGRSKLGGSGGAARVAAAAAFA